MIPKAPFPSAYPGGLGYQVFTNVHLPFNTASGKCQVKADISFWDYGSRPSCDLAVHSFWQGKVTLLSGQDWQVGIVPNSLNQIFLFENSRLLLRPWEQRNQPFNAYNGGLAAVPLSQKLFVAGHAYQLDWVAGPQDGEAKPALRFTEPIHPAGRIENHRQIHSTTRPVRAGHIWWCWIGRPPARRFRPESYNQPDIRLEQNGTEAFCNSGSSQWGKALFRG